MADTMRTVADLVTRLADNNAREISAQDLRDFLVTVLAGHHETWVTTAVATVISAINVWADALGTAWGVDSDPRNWSSPSAGVLQYDGAVGREGEMFASWSITSAGSNKTYELAIAQNGTPITRSLVRHKVASGLDVVSGSIQAHVHISPGDKFNVAVRNITDATDLTFETLNLVARDVPHQ